VPKTFVTSSNASTTGFIDLERPPPIGQAIRFGNMLFVSGQGLRDPVMARAPRS
jgi:2-iminobutanoate/2-iminopropanoate deaminase